MDSHTESIADPVSLMSKNLAAASIVDDLEATSAEIVSHDRPHLVADDSKALPTEIIDKKDFPTLDADELASHLDSFNLFPKLPTEIRLRVWKHALSIPQLINVKLSGSRPEASRILCSNSRLHASAQHPSSALSIRHTNHESRDVAKKIYGNEPIKLSAFFNPIFIDCSRDTLVVTEDVLSLLMDYLPMGGQQSQLECYEKIRFVVIDLETFFSRALSDSDRSRVGARWDPVSVSVIPKVSALIRIFGNTEEVIMVTPRERESEKAFVERLTKKLNTKLDLELACWAKWGEEVSWKKPKIAALSKEEMRTLSLSR